MCRFMKRNLKKIVINKVILILIFVQFVIVPNYTVYAATIANNNENLSIEVRKEDVRWRFKRKNGKLYKRLYNYTEKKWIGKWILVK